MQLLLITIFVFIVPLIGVLYLLARFERWFEPNRDNDTKDELFASPEQLHAFIQRQKSNNLLEDEIESVTEAIKDRVAEQADESVFVEGWGTFYRRGNGWHGPGGFYGAGTPMAQKCEEALKELKGEK